MFYRKLTEVEKVQAAALSGPERMHAIFRGELTLETIYRSSLDVVGGFDADGKLRFFYWLYHRDRNSACIGVGVIGRINREILAAMMDVLEFLCRDRVIIGEISRENPAGLRLSQVLGAEFSGIIPGACCDGSDRVTVYFPKNYRKD